MTRRAKEDSYQTGFCHEHALILYVYLSGDDMESVLTVSLNLGALHEAFD